MNRGMLHLTASGERGSQGGIFVPNFVVNLIRRVRISWVADEVCEEDFGAVHWKPPESLRSRPRPRSSQRGEQLAEFVVEVFAPRDRSGHLFLEQFAESFP